jgi:cell division protein FtsZ
VVATGIDQAAMGGGRPAATTAEARIAEVTQKLRTAERVERSEPSRPVSLATPVAAPPPAAPPGPSAEAIARDAHAAVAAALITSIEDVTIRPMPQPKPSFFQEPGAPPPAEPPAPRNFIPPTPERIASRPPRMPRIDELPIPAQKEIRAKRGELAEQEHPEKRKGGLLRRLAAVGLGRREEEAEKPASVRPVRPMPRPVDRAAGPAPLPPLPPRPARAPEVRGPEPVSDYAKRPAAHAGLDPLGRQTPVHNTGEDDQLEIPAFLRRQAN